MPFAIQAYNEATVAMVVEVSKLMEASKSLRRVPELERQNKEVNELFNVAREEASVTTIDQ